MQILAVGNQKGGTAKTTTAASLAVVLSRKGVRVHVIDMDAQSHLTKCLGRRDDDALLYNALRDRSALPVIPVSDYLTLTPSSVDLAKAESEFISEHARENILKTCLQATEIGEDTLVIIDCPPSLGILAVNCLTAADKLLVVVQPGGFELEALARLQETVAVVRERINPELEIAGVVLTNCKMRRTITAQIEQEIGRSYTVLGLVREDAELLYATTEGRLPELRRSKALSDYQAVADKLQQQLPWRARLAV